jgi:hypothetical protein
MPLFQLYRGDSFNGGGSRSTRREPPTMGKQLVNFITCGCESSALLKTYVYRRGNNVVISRTNSKKSLKIPKGQLETVYRRRTDKSMAKRKSTKGQTTINKTYI